MKEVYNTREDVFRVMDAELSEEEKKEVMECVDISDLHFSLGMYIRNRFLYEDDDVMDEVLSLFDDDDSNVIIAPDGTKHRFVLGFADMQWQPVAIGYKEYLIESLMKNTHIL